MKNVVLLGAGGHHKVIKEIIQDSAEYKAAAVLDDRFDHSEMMDGIVYGPMSLVNKWLQAEDKSLLVIAIGSNEIRKRLSEELELQGAQFATIIHSSAVVSSSAIISEGSVVMANVVINADAVIGKHAIVNTSSIVEHDCVIGDYAHLSSGCIVAGGATIGAGVYLKPGAIIMQNERIEAGPS